MDGKLKGGIKLKNALRLSLVVFISILTFSLTINTGFAYSETFASNNQVTKKQDKKVEDNFTIGEEEKFLHNYFKENGISYKVGSQEYIDFLVSLLLDDGDFSKLKQEPNYEGIRTYASTYLQELENAQVNGNVNSFHLNPSIEKKTIKEIRDQNDLDNKRESIISPLAISPGPDGSDYNVSAAINYAATWWDGRNPTYGSFSNDCTNFASQIVHAGGKPIYKPSTIPTTIYSTTNYWYSYNLRVSTSWMRVSDFYSYWVNKRGYAHKTFTGRTSDFYN